jgi:hypothetical protein
MVGLTTLYTTYVTLNNTLVVYYIHFVLFLAQQCYSTTRNMSSIDEKCIDMIITLECEPELTTFHVGLVSRMTPPTNKAIIIAPTGLFTDILYDTQWDALALNRSS